MGLRVVRRQSVIILVINKSRNHSYDYGPTSDSTQSYKVFFHTNVNDKNKATASILKLSRVINFKYRLQPHKKM